MSSGRGYDSNQQLTGWQLRDWQLRESAMDEPLRRHMRRVGNSIANRLKDTFMTPNLLTIIGFGFELGGCILFLLGTHLSVIIGSIFLLIFIYLDFADGSLARLTNRTSYLGKFLDETLDEIGCFMIPFSLSAGCVSITGDRLFFLLGFLIYASDTVMSGASSRFRKAPFNQQSDQDYVSQKMDSSLLFRIGRVIYPIYFYRLYLILLFAIFNEMLIFMHIMTVYSVITNGVFVLYVGYAVFRQSKEQERP